MYTLCSEIEVGGKRFQGVHSVNISRSVNEIMSTATIKVPVTAVLKHNNVVTAVETAREINVGDKVTIRLGYNGQNNTEFVGYVKQLNLCAPLEIVCEDAFYLTRHTTISHSGTIELKALLEKAGLKVAYATPLKLSGFVVDSKPVSWVLGKLKTEYGLSVFFDFEGRICAAPTYKVTAGETVKYELRRNVIKDDNLTYQREEDVKVKIKATCYYKNGTKVEATAGQDGGAQTELFFYDVESKTELATLAKAELDRRSYTGYRGDIETFLQPYAAPGYTAAIIDHLYSQRSGNYYIESVEINYGTSGARRRVQLGIKI